MAMPPRDVDKAGVHLFRCMVAVIMLTGILLGMSMSRVIMNCEMEDDVVNGFIEVGDQLYLCEPVGSGDNRVQD